MIPHIHLGIEGFLSLVLYSAMWVAFVVSVFWQPSAGVYLFVLSLPLQTGRYKIHDFPLGSNFIDILLLGTLLGLWLKGQEIFPKSPINKLLVVLAVYYYFSLWEGALFIDVLPPLWISDPRFSDWKNYVEMFLFAPVVAAALKEKKQIKLLLIFMSLSMLIVNRNYYNLMSDRDLTRFSYDVRDAGLLGYAGVNGLAALEVMFSSFLLGIYSYANTLKLKIGILSLLVISVYCLLFSFSRGGYVGMLAALVVLGILRNRKLLILVGALLISWQAILPISVQERILMTTDNAGNIDSSAQERVELWQDALDLFMKNPVTGTGFHTYEYLGRVGPYRDTHNYYIKVLVETGIVGFILFINLLYRLAMMGFRLFRTSDEPFWSGIGLGFFALVCSAIVVNFFGDRWTYQQVDGFLWVLIGCVIRGQIMADTKKQATAESTVTEINTVPRRYREFTSGRRPRRSRYGLSGGLFPSAGASPLLQKR